MKIKNWSVSLWAFDFDYDFLKQKMVDLVYNINIEDKIK